MPQVDAYLPVIMQAGTAKDVEAFLDLATDLEKVEMLRDTLAKCIDMPLFVTLHHLPSIIDAYSLVVLMAKAADGSEYVLAIANAMGPPVRFTRGDRALTRARVCETFPAPTHTVTGRAMGRPDLVPPPDAALVVHTRHASGGAGSAGQTHDVARDAERDVPSGLQVQS